MVDLEKINNIQSELCNIHDNGKKLIDWFCCLESLLKSNSLDSELVLVCENSFQKIKDNGDFDDSIKIRIQGIIAFLGQNVKPKILTGKNAPRSIKDKISLNRNILHAIGVAFKNFGIEFVLSAIPLLSPLENSKDLVKDMINHIILNFRLWILDPLKKNALGAKLSFFLTNLLPIANKTFEIALSLENKMRPMQQKSLENIGEQIFECFPKICSDFSDWQEFDKMDYMILDLLTFYKKQGKQKVVNELLKGIDKIMQKLISKGISQKFMEKLRNQYLPIIKEYHNNPDNNIKITTHSLLNLFIQGLTKEEAINEASTIFRNLNSLELNKICNTDLKNDKFDKIENNFDKLNNLENSIKMINYEKMENEMTIKTLENNVEMKNNKNKAKSELVNKILLDIEMFGKIIKQKQIDDNYKKEIFNFVVKNLNTSNKELKLKILLLLNDLIASEENFLNKFPETIDKIISTSNSSRPVVVATLKCFITALFKLNKIDNFTYEKLFIPAIKYSFEVLKMKELKVKKKSSKLVFLLNEKVIQLKYANPNFSNCSFAAFIILFAFDHFNTKLTLFTPESIRVISSLIQNLKDSLSIEETDAILKKLISLNSKNAASEINKEIITALKHFIQRTRAKKIRELLPTIMTYVSAVVSETKFLDKHKGGISNNKKSNSNLLRGSLAQLLTQLAAKLKNDVLEPYLPREKWVLHKMRNIRRMKKRFKSVMRKPHPRVHY